MATEGPSPICPPLIFGLMKGTRCVDVVQPPQDGQSPTRWLWTV